MKAQEKLRHRGRKKCPWRNDRKVRMYLDDKLESKIALRIRKACRLKDNEEKNPQ